MLVARGVILTFERSEPVWLPVSGARLYRGVRHLLREAAAAAVPGAAKLAVVALAGKSQVEVIATVSVRGGSRVLAVAFPCYVPGTLSRGFAEGIARG